MKVRIHTTAGEFVIERDTESAPRTSENFVGYVNDGFYDGTIFDRVIDGCMIQGRGLEPRMRQKETGAPIECEADNGLVNCTGAVAMARTADPHSATAQFFVNVNDNDFLNHKAKTAQGWGYAVFGKVVSGMEVVTRIEECATTTRGMHQDVPTEDIVIERAELLDDE